MLSESVVENPGRGHYGTQKQRIISPDLARGLALLGIALANIGTAWTTSPDADLAPSIGGAAVDSLPDQITIVFSTMFAHVRGLPMFSVMLGVGIGMIAASLWRRHYPPGRARRVLIRRYGFLALFGAVHLVFLFYGDIIFFYGLVGMLLALVLTWKNRTLLWVAGIMYALSLLVMIGAAVLTANFPEETAASLLAATSIADSYPEMVIDNLLILVFSVLGFVFQAFMYLPLMIVGFVAGRAGVLQNIAAHRRLLWTWVGVTIAVVLLIGLPWGLSEIGVLPTSQAGMWFMLNQGFGLLTGPGIVAAAALLCQPLQDRLNATARQGGQLRLPTPVAALTALGKRSMSGYLLQSILLFALLMPFTLNLGEGRGAFFKAMIAVGVWVATLLGAYALERAGSPGPFEWLHRRLSYGRDGLPERYAGPGGAQQTAPLPAHPATPPGMAPPAAVLPFTPAPQQNPQVTRGAGDPDHAHPEAPDNPYRRG